ncbi:MAG: hypothetical protein AB8E15_06350 [Bdellovibrionales bacterium]
MKTIVLLILLIGSFKLLAGDGIDWSRSYTIPKDGRWNPYLLSESDFVKFRENGRLHTLVWPVEITGILLPYKPIKSFIESETRNPLRKVLAKIFQSLSNVKSMDQIYDWMGLNSFPKEHYEEPFVVPYPTNQPKDIPMGLGLIERDGAKGFTFSCATCHSANLFGSKIIGLTNRFPRANDTFINGQKAASITPSLMFKASTGATSAERRMFKKSKEALKYVGVKSPQVLGLDTSLAQVAISLSKRAKDQHASLVKKNRRSPRNEKLRKFVADSKPMAWWTLKYKNRWLADGSVVSGNPILTNILWNELGRGTNLIELEKWIDRNMLKIKELTTASFSAEPPQITNFYSWSFLDLNSAKRGQKLFKNNCKKCHGIYNKAWDNDEIVGLSISELIQTTSVDYPQPTKVKNVGTDPNRWQGMKSLVQLNELKISNKYGIVIETQEGYVPPPLVGIWARWPYFHNNSIPNLCALLSLPENRPARFWMGEAINTETDFDFNCNGYPVGENTPSKWKKNKDYLYDTTRKGMSNSGHSKVLKNWAGGEKFSPQNKQDLIRFLQTL